MKTLAPTTSVRPEPPTTVRPEPPTTVRPEPVEGRFATGLDRPVLSIVEGLSPNGWEPTGFCTGRITP